MSEQTTLFPTCLDCGAAVEPKNENKPMPERCPECRKRRKREQNNQSYHRAAQAREAKPRPELARLPVKVLDISPAVTDESWWWYLSGYRGNTMPWRHFRESLPDGAFDGLVVESEGQRYEVVSGQLVQPGEYRQGQMEVGR